METFRDLKVWEKAHQMVLDVYRVTASFPHEEKFGIVSQLRRAASSVPTNIVEGCKRKSRQDLLRFLNIADSSLEETKYLLFLGCDLGYLKKQMLKSLETQCDEIGRMLCGLQKNLEAREKK